MFLGFCGLVDFSRENTHFFHIGSVSLTAEPARSATLDCARAARSNRALVTYDPNYRANLWQDKAAAIVRMKEPLCFTDILKVSDEELPLLTGTDDLESVTQMLASYGIRLILVTLGPDGCLLKTKNASFRAVCPKVHPIDTTGAGDIFGGSALSRLLELEKSIDALTEEDLAYIGSFAAAAASLSTEVSGGIPSIPEKDAVLKAM